jgi:hypothetical protein
MEALVEVKMVTMFAKFKEWVIIKATEVKVVVVLSREVVGLVSLAMGTR